MPVKDMTVEIGYKIQTTKLDGDTEKWKALIIQDDLKLAVYGTFDSEEVAISVASSLYERYLLIGVYGLMRKADLLVI